jgi:hypothetical protein
MDGYSPKLQEVYSLAVPRQRTGYSDSHLLAVRSCSCLIGAILPLKDLIIYSSCVSPVNPHKKWRADERTPTAFLLIRCVRSGDSGRWKGLQIPHR